MLATLQPTAEQCAVCQKARKDDCVDAEYKNDSYHDNLSLILSPPVKFSSEMSSSKLLISTPTNSRLVSTRMLNVKLPART